MKGREEGIGLTDAACRVRAMAERRISIVSVVWVWCVMECSASSMVDMEGACG